MIRKQAACSSSSDTHQTPSVIENGFLVLCCVLFFSSVVLFLFIVQRVLAGFGREFCNANASSTSIESIAGDVFWYQN